MERLVTLSDEGYSGDGCRGGVRWLAEVPAGKFGMPQRGRECSDREDVELGISSEGLEESQQGGVGSAVARWRGKRGGEREQYLLSFHR